MSSVLLVLVVLLCDVLLGVVALDPWRLFNIYVRDMPLLHPDVEGPYSSVYPQTGLLASSLDSASRPVFVRPSLRGQSSLVSQYSSNGTTSSIATNIAISNVGRHFFNNFFMNVPGVNIGYNMSLNFTLVDPVSKIYGWGMTKFFPLDSLGYGLTESFAAPNVSDPNPDYTPHNFGFSTEMTINFMYTGGEVFSFTGNDDAWVFIDGNLTSCDLGGIHAPATCNLALDSMGLSTTDMHTLKFFHIQRHSPGCTFIITTSITPKDLAPLIEDTTQHVLIDGATQVILRTVLDASMGAVNSASATSVWYSILRNPSNGTLRATPNPGVYVYVPNPGFAGNDSVLWAASNQYATSHPSTINFIVDAVSTIDSYLVAPGLDFGTTKIGQQTKLEVDVKFSNGTQVPISIVSYYFPTGPALGSITVFQNNTMVYAAKSPGLENFMYIVTGPNGTFGKNYFSGNITGPDSGQSGTPLNTGVIVGIVVGSVVVASLLIGGITYLVYQHCMAAKFAKSWQDQWAAGNVHNNPLFQASSKEYDNPIYKATAN